MKYVIRQEQSMEIRQCVCGDYPKFYIPNPYYTDLWLQCSCGRYTKNTGGFHYAREISLEEAQAAAIKLWNKEEIMEKYI